MMLVENIVQKILSQQMTENRTIISLLFYLSHTTTPNHKYCQLLWRATAYGITIVGLIALTILMLVKVITLAWLPNYSVWSISGLTTFCLLLLQINLTQNPLSWRF